MADIDRWPHSKEAALLPHLHVCPLCKIRYSCACSQYDRREKLVCITCERKGK